MKLITAITVLFLLLNTAHSQVSVKIRKNGSGGEVDVKTAGKTGSNNNTSGNTEINNSKPASPAATTPVKPAADTTARPAGTSSFDAAYNGPAKVQLKSFWRQLEALRSGNGTGSTLMNAERMLAQVKEKDPSYNVADLETEVAGYRNTADRQAKAQTDAANAAQAELSYFNKVWQNMTGIYSKGSDIEPGITGKSYYDRVQELNLPEYKEKKKSATTPEASKIIEEVDRGLADYDNYVKRSDRLRWNVTEIMVKSRNEANPQRKIQMLEEARWECEAVLAVSPANAAFKQKLEEVNKLLGSAGSEASKFYTSDFHKQNVGKIVWSNKPLVIGKESEMAANIKNSFKTGEAIFGTIYLGNTARQLMDGNDRIRVIIKVDGGTAVWGGDLSYFILPLTVQDKSYIQFALLPDDQWFSANYAPYITRENWTYSYLLDELAGAGDISHDITCEFDFPTPVQGNIKSQLSLDLGGGSAAIKTLSAKLHDQLMASRTLPKAGMSNAAMEQQMVSAANNLGWNDKFLKAIITSSSWAIAKNDLTGAILYRYVGAVCTTKGTDGKCYYQEFTFRQDYTGGGNYSSTIKYNSYGGKREIGCDKIK